jgi:hypothetical protein
MINTDYDLHTTWISNTYTNKKIQKNPREIFMRQFFNEPTSVPSVPSVPSDTVILYEYFIYPL